MVRLSSTTILAEATQILKDAGYERVRKLGDFDLPFGRLFEDPFGVVLVTVWDTWDALCAEWAAAQGVLVEVISQHIPRSDAKAWDGYLVLLLPSESGGIEESEVDKLRQDTSRVRKLVAVGRGLRHLQDLERVLAPLLPLSVGNLNGRAADALEVLPDLIQDEEIPRDSVVAVANAFADGSSLVESLHKHLWGDDAN